MDGSTGDGPKALEHRVEQRLQETAVAGAEQAERDRRVDVAPTHGSDYLKQKQQQNMQFWHGTQKLKIDRTVRVWMVNGE